MSGDEAAIHSSASPPVPSVRQSPRDGRGEGQHARSGSAFLPAAWRIAWRELRGGFTGLRIFLACLVLGVATIAGIGSLAAAAEAGLAAGARGLLGGDVEAQLLYRPASAAARAVLAKAGRLSEVVTMRAMARSPGGRRQSLVALEAVDLAYPLYGQVTLAPRQSLASVLARRHGLYGVAADPALLRRLRVKPGDRIKIGSETFALRAVLRRQPDAAPGGLILGPPLLISDEALAATGLLGPGALVTYHYRLQLPAGESARTWAAAARRRLPGAGWRIRTAANAAPGLRRLIERVAMFLSLVGLAALLVGGIGIANAVTGYIGGKTATIATLKALGAPNRLVLAAYGLQLSALALAGIAAALVVGILLPAALAPTVDLLLPLPLKFGIYPLPLALAAAYGVLTALVFSVGPLASVGRVAPGPLFRDMVAPLRRSPPFWALATGAIAAIALAALAILTAADRRLAFWCVAGTAAAFVLCRASAAGIILAVRHLPRPRRPLLRLALANLGRPGAATAPVVQSLGLGLGFLVTVMLVEANLAHEVSARLPAKAPAFFFIDVEPAQLAPFEAIVHATPQARLEEVPMLRGRITRLNGVAADKAPIAASARWAVDSDRGLTYAAHLPKGSRLVAGRWWPPDYRGPPLVSFDAGLAKGMGLRVGDKLTVEVLGRDITARIANLRQIHWQRLGINFVLVFSPAVLEAAPQTVLAAVYLPRPEEDSFLSRVTKAFPNVSAIPVHPALRAVGRVLALVGEAIDTAALATVVAGILVLAGALAADQQRRLYDAVVLKVLGATRRTIAALFLIEHGLLGAVAALLAGGFGTLAAYLLVSRVMGLDWTLFWPPLVVTIAAAVLVTLILGLFGTWRALGVAAARHLRNN